MIKCINKQISIGGNVKDVIVEATAVVGKITDMIGETCPPEEAHAFKESFASLLKSAVNGEFGHQRQQMEEKTEGVRFIVRETDK